MWCNDHVKDSHYDGIYMPAPHYHASWKKKKEEKFKRSTKKPKGNNKKPISNNTCDSKAPYSSNLKISLNLQGALFSNLGFSDRDSELMESDIL